MRPAVSVIVNCFNGEQFLEECLQSVLQQTFENWEVIFWDNNSADRSVQIAEKFNDPRMRYFTQDKTLRLYAARNHALEKASADLICFLDVDDFWDPEKLEAQIPLFDDPKVGLVYTNYWFLDEVKRTRKRGLSGSIQSGQVLDWVLEKDSIVISTAMIRRTSLGVEPPCDSKLNVIGDFDLWVKIAQNWEVRGIDETLATYRWHGENDTIKKRGIHLDELHTWLLERSSIEFISQYHGFKVRAESVACRRLFCDLEKNFSFCRIASTFSEPYIERKLTLLIKMFYRGLFRAIKNIWSNVGLT